jgi:hypothetical protein
MGMEPLWIALGSDANDHNFGADDEKASYLCNSRELLGRISLRRASPACV